MPRNTALDSPYEGLSIGASSWLWENHDEHVAYLLNDIKTAAAGKERNLSRFFAITKYTLKARFFNHIIGPFMDLERVFRAGLGMPNNTGSAFTEEERKAYEAIEKQIPELTSTMKKVVRAGASHFVKLATWQMDEAMHKARSDDVTRINAIVSEAAVPNPKRDGRFRGITTTTLKTARGFNHPDFARLLCPMKLVEEFDADPNLFMQKVKGGEIELFANDLPVFCYPFGHKYNPDDIEDGLCRCELLTRCMGATLTGPSTTFGDDRASKNQSVSFKHKYFDVVPQDVAYHVTLIRSALSDATSFGPYRIKCWDGVNLDTPDHSSHVAHPSGTPAPDGLQFFGTDCPDTHPVRLPLLFVEIVWDTRPFNNPELWPKDGTQPFIFSMGDPTGFGQHADYVFGWEGDSLKRAMDVCTGGDGLPQNCPALTLQDIETMNNCRLPAKVDEVVEDQYLDRLPGCNPVQSGPGPATMVPDCQAPSVTVDTPHPTAPPAVVTPPWTINI
ncbi:hypothetical protein MD484_g6528, partial [Candolleomyces efflorescens]